MSEPRSLPPRPNLRHLRDEAKRRRKAGESPSLALAQLALAREYGLQACWRARVQMTRELVHRGAALAFRDGGSAIGAALHGSRHCQHPEGGPTMQTDDEIPKAPYAEIVRFLLDAGAEIPERIGERGRRATTLIAELGLDPPA